MRGGLTYGAGGQDGEPNRHLERRAALQRQHCGAEAQRRPHKRAREGAESQIAWCEGFKGGVTYELWSVQDG
jgi:hypothetical protein